MVSYQNIPYIATAVFALLMLLLVVYFIRVSFKEKRQEENFEKQLRHTLDPNLIEKEKDSFLASKLKILPEKMIKSGIVDEKTNPQDLQRKLTLMAALVFTGTVFLTQNVFAGFVPVALIYTSLMMLSVFKISKTKNLIDEQIPAFVATFKANIQANQHAQNAMVRAINNTAQPLYGELSYAKAIMEAGDFRAGIVALRKSTDNDTLRQMASCVELASSSGSNIEGQLEIIEEIIADKQSIERKKRLGVNANKPLFIVSALFVPISFIGSYLMSEMHRDYWFTTTASWLVLIGVIIAMALSLYATWKVIQKVEIN